MCLRPHPIQSAVRMYSHSSSNSPSTTHSETFTHFQFRDKNYATKGGDRKSSLLPERERILLLFLVGTQDFKAVEVNSRFKGAQQFFQEAILSDDHAPRHITAPQRLRLHVLPGSPRCLLSCTHPSQTQKVPQVYSSWQPLSIPGVTILSRNKMPGTHCSGEKVGNPIYPWRRGQNNWWQVTVPSRDFFQHTRLNNYKQLFVGQVPTGDWLLNNLSINTFLQNWLIGDKQFRNTGMYFSDRKQI